MNDLLNEDALIPTGFEEHVIGATYEGLAIMSTKGIMDKLQTDHGLSELEAIEYFEYNIIGSIHENGPVYINDIDLDFSSNEKLNNFLKKG